MIYLTGDTHGGIDLDKLTGNDLLLVSEIAERLSKKD